ncbi:MAG: ribosome small subunit-dependent GTPase A [Thermodesulfobacteriota bacterium]
MKKTSREIHAIDKMGFNQLLLKNVDSEKASIYDIARVIAVHKDSYVISKGSGDVFAELVGKLIYLADSAMDLPTVGDWVYADFYDNDTHAIIHGVIPRLTLMKRKRAGKNIDYQLIAANIDSAFIIQSLDENFNLRRLERYLVMINEYDIDPIVLLSKCDLIAEDKIIEKINVVKEIMPNLTIIPFSNENGMNLDQIQTLLHANKTYCLVGSSGVGKTTLLNSLLGGAELETSPVREKDSKGRHTTTHRQLVQLPNGSMIIDTPGMRELGNLFVDSGLDETFSEIIELLKQCKFKNCSHVNEVGCAILAAIDEGELSEKRYQNYEAMQREARFNDMSYYEKRQKDKQFGKLIKSTLKGKKNK